MNIGNININSNNNGQSNNMPNTYGVEFILYTTLISILIAKDLTSNEQNLLGNFLITIGQNVEMISFITMPTSSCDISNLENLILNKNNST